MVGEGIKLKARGYITLRKGGRVVYRNHNQIGPDMLKIVTMCLSQLQGNRQVDTIKAIGDFGSIDRPITGINYESETNTIIFSTVFYEFDFNGTLESLELLSLSLGNALLAKKDDLDIFKDGNSRLQIDWAIKINDC